MPSDRAESTEKTKHESPYRQQARLAFYFIWGAAALLIGAVFYVFYLIFESNAPGSGFYFLAAMASVGGLWAVFATDMGRSPPTFITNLGKARRVVLGFAMMVAGIVSGDLGIYLMVPGLFRALRSNDETIFGLLPKTALLALLVCSVLMTLGMVVSPREPELSERDIYAE